MLRPSGKGLMTEVIGVFYLPTNKEEHKRRFIAWSVKCYVKPLSKLLASMLSAVDTVRQSYFDTNHWRDGVNHMWILKIYKDLSENKQPTSLSSCNSIKTADFSTVYTTIAHSNLQTDEGVVINATSNNISVLLVEETGITCENHLAAASHWQTLPPTVESSTPRHELGPKSQL